MYKWVAANILGWGTGMAVGLALGFLVPIAGDILAVIAFVIILSFIGAGLLDVDHGEFLKNTWLGLLVGLVAAFIFVLVADTFLPLGLSHSISLLIAVALGSRVQQRAVPSKAWWIMSLASMILGFVFVGGVDFLIDLNLEVLDVRVVDYSALPDWFLIGAILGGCYGVFTGIDSKSWKREKS